MSGLKEKVVYVEKRYCEICDSWTETPATYCKQCGSKLTYSPQKCSTDLVRLEDAEDYAQQKLNELKQKLKELWNQRPLPKDFDTGVRDELDPTCTKLNMYGYIEANEKWRRKFEELLEEEKEAK